MPDFFLQDPSGYNADFDEEYEAEDEYDTETGNVQNDWYQNTASETFEDHRACMKITSTADGEGVYHELTVESGAKYVLEFDYYIPTVGNEIDWQVYDQTNGADIDSGTLTYTGRWHGHYITMTVPATCTTARLFFRSGSAGTVSFYLDSVRFQGNLIAIDPEIGGGFDYPDQRNSRRLANGDLLTDRSGRTYSHSLSFPVLTADQYDLLMKAVRSDKVSYIDDADLPQMVEYFTHYEQNSYAYSGVTNPSGSHVAYYDSDVDLPSASSDFEATEFSTADYQAVDGYGGGTVDTALSGAGDINKYIYHKLEIDISGDYSAIDDIRSFWIWYAGEGEDLSDNALNGLVMYAWNGTVWMRLQEAYGDGEHKLIYSVEDAAQAQDFVDISNNVVRILIRTLGLKGSTGSLTLKSNYIRMQINKGYESYIPLSHKAQLDAGGDVVEVRDVNQDSVKTLGTHYKIGDGLDKLNAVSVNVGHTYKVTYTPQMAVQVGAVSEQRHPGGAAGSKPRALSLSVTGVIPLTEVSD